ncbi:hypothetical protein EDC01DRAFT_626833 [Geopyxis carbonaria]|nr:hypothetical protein EDC01DRAFT_626833 [Geopyxis carbonaria]
MCVAVGYDLNRNYTDFGQKLWRDLVKTIHVTKAEPKWGWTREVTENVMKAIASDTVRNLRAKARRAQKRKRDTTIAPSASSLEEPEVEKLNKRSNKKKGKMTYIRKPNRKLPTAGSAVSPLISHSPGIDEDSFGLSIDPALLNSTSLLTEGADVEHQQQEDRGTNRVVSHDTP